MGASKTATVLKTLIPEYDSKATRAMYMYGPFKLAASNVWTDPHTVCINN